MSVKDNKKLLLWNKINIALSVFLLAFASYWILQNIIEGKPYYNHLIFGILGLILLTSAFMNIKKFKAESEGITIADERSRRIGEKAGLFAFFMLIVILISSSMANSILNLGLEYTMTVNVIWVASAFSWIIIAYYLDKKGET